jgi:hypothetical protein
MNEYSQIDNTKAYQLSIINEAKEALREAIKAKDAVQAKQWGLGDVEAEPLPSEEYRIAQIEAQALVNVKATLLVDIMDVYTRGWA